MSLYSLTYNTFEAHSFTLTYNTHLDLHFLATILILKIFQVFFNSRNTRRSGELFLIFPAGFKTLIVTICLLFVFFEQVKLIFYVF